VQAQVAIHTLLIKLFMRATGVGKCYWPRMRWGYGVVRMQREQFTSKRLVSPSFRALANSSESALSGGELDREACVIYCMGKEQNGKKIAKELGCSAHKVERFMDSLGWAFYSKICENKEKPFCLVYFLICSYNFSVFHFALSRSAQLHNLIKKVRRLCWCARRIIKCPATPTKRFHNQVEPLRKFQAGDFKGRRS
jgi:hypothetical protein